jgi:hypothetical protein
MEIGRRDTLRTIHRGGTGPAIPRAIRDSLVRRYSPRGARVSATSFTESMIPRNYPAIADMRVDDSGRLWIRKTDTPARTPVFDLFDRSGNHLGSVKAGFPIQGVPLAVGDAVYAITTNADDVPFVVRARLER